VRYPDYVYPRGSIHLSWVLAWMLSCCVIKWGELWHALAEFSQRWQGIWQRIRTRAIICSFLFWVDGKGEFLQGRKQIWRVQVAHLRNAARALSSLSQWWSKTSSDTLKSILLSRTISVHLPKTKGMTYLLTCETAFSGRHFNVTQRKRLEIRMFSIIKRRTLSSSNVVYKTRNFPVVESKPTAGKPY